MTHTRKKRVYNDAEYNSSDGMLTSVWGPGMWHYLHTMSFNYPINPSPSDKLNYKNFILNLQYTLPCKYCRINLVKNLKQLPIHATDMKNRESFSKYVYNLHEIINKMLKKKSGLSYADIRERYEHFRARCTEENLKVFKYKKMQTKKKKEKGCTEPLYGKKSKCILKIVPQSTKENTFQMDKQCIKIK